MVLVRHGVLVFHRFFGVLTKMIVSEAVEFVCIFDHVWILGDSVGWETDVGSMWKMDAIVEFDSFRVVDDSVEAHCLS